MTRGDLAVRYIQVREERIMDEKLPQEVGLLRRITEGLLLWRSHAAQRKDLTQGVITDCSCSHTRWRSRTYAKRVSNSRTSDDDATLIERVV